MVLYRVETSLIFPEAVVKWLERESVVEIKEYEL
jgi:hypothetical protein